MNTTDDGRHPSGRAVVNGASEAVSALRASVPDAWRNFLKWAFPFLSVLVGGGFLAIAGSDDHSGGMAVIAVITGFVLILGAMDAKADHARADEMRVWACHLADMVAKDTVTTFKVDHSFEGYFAKLDERVREIIAQGTETGTAETEGLGPKDDGPVPNGDAPNV